MNAPYPQLTVADVPEVRRLYERSRAFFELISGQGPSDDAPERLFTGRPEGLSAEDKIVFGVFQEAQLSQ